MTLPAARGPQGSNAATATCTLLTTRQMRRRRRRKPENPWRIASYRSLQCDVHLFRRLLLVRASPPLCWQRQRLNLATAGDTCQPGRSVAHLEWHYLSAAVFSTCLLYIFTCTCIICPKAYSCDDLVTFIIRRVYFLCTLADAFCHSV